MKGRGVLLSRWPWALAFVGLLGALLAHALGTQSARVLLREPLVPRSARGPLVAVPLVPGPSAGGVRVHAIALSRRRAVPTRGAPGALAVPRSPGDELTPPRCPPARDRDGVPLRVRTCRGGAHCGAGTRRGRSRAAPLGRVPGGPAGFGRVPPARSHGERRRADRPVGLPSARGRRRPRPDPGCTGPPSRGLGGEERPRPVDRPAAHGSPSRAAECHVAPLGRPELDLVEPGGRTGARLRRWPAVSIVAGGPGVARGLRRVLRSALCCALPALGLAGLYAVLTPPLFGPDEPYHLLGFADLVHDARLADDTVEWMGQTHLLRIRYRPEERFRSVDPGRPFVADDDQLKPTEVEMRSATLACLWRALGPALRGLGAPQTLLALRLVNALRVRARRWRRRRARSGVCRAPRARSGSCSRSSSCRRCRSSRCTCPRPPYCARPTCSFRPARGPVPGRAARALGRVPARPRDRADARRRAVALAVARPSSRRRSPARLRHRSQCGLTGPRVVRLLAGCRARARRVRPPAQRRLRADGQGLVAVRPAAAAPALDRS